MSLRPYLSAVRGLEQLPGLARELGLAPLWHELALEALGAGPAPGTSDGRAAVVGRRNRFFALGVECAGPIPEARRLARTLAARGQAALVLALDPGARVLALAATHGACPALAITLTGITATQLRQLERGRGGAEESAAGLAARWAEALAGQPVGARFFQEFRRVLAGFVSSLPRRIPRRDRHPLALLSLTRVLFLYFVQDRGWLDGRPRFLREELDRCLGAGRSVETGFLHPLFFGTLNRPLHGRPAAARAFGRVPFLNGGLFERHMLERRWHPSFSNERWRQAFDDLFERFHFTIGQDESDQPTIGPDMLGRVFEGVMDPGERRAAGAFYTPAALVDEVVDGALVRWLAGRLGGSTEQARARLAASDGEALDQLRAVAVLDPAVGSGAFLLGALRRLVGARTAAGESRSRATRAVLAGNLFGVDRNPSAVRLAELRLWLEVLEAEESSDPERVEPLPNLDSFVRQGDSLIEPLLAPLPAGPGDAASLAALRQSLLTATGPEKHRLLRALRRAELQAARHAVDRSVAAVEERLREVRSSSRSPDLFAVRPRPSIAVRRTLEGLRLERARLRALAGRLRDADELPWFHYRAQFADVMAHGGFDLVLGNPPWVRAEALGPTERRVLKERFRWFRPGSGRGYAHLPDLSVAFLERGVELLHPDGLLGMLVPAKLLTAGYAAALRSELSRRTTLLVLDDLTGRARQAFDATTYPLALLLRSGAPPGGHRVDLALCGGDSMAQVTLGADPWVPVSAGASGLAAMDRHPTIGDRFRAGLGVKTGADAVFLDPPGDVEASVIRPAVRGRDVRAFRVMPAHRLLWPADRLGVPLPRLPLGAARHLAAHAATLRRRADYRDGPYCTLFRTRLACRGHRLVWPDLSRRLEAAPLAGPGLDRAVPLNTVYVLALPDADTLLRLAAWLNLTWVRALARSRATVAASGFARFNAAVVEALPLPDPALTDAELLRIGRAAAGGGGFDQSAADERGAELLGLRARERDALRRVV